MNKTLFGLITAAALIAVGVLVYNRSTENASRLNGAKTVADLKPADAPTDAKCCCSDLASGKSTCCSDSVATSTGCPSCKSATVAACCDSETVATSKKEEACCGACADGGDCCADKAAEDTSEAGAVTVAVAKPCGCLNECTCDKNTSETSIPK